MTPVSPDHALAALNWRYAVKKFDPARRIPADQWRVLEESLRLSPSSYGLQLWKFFVVTDGAVREALVEHSWGQRQVADADKLVVFAVKKDIGPADVQKLIDRTAAVRGIPATALDGYKGMMLNTVTKTPAAELAAWARNQVYIAHGVFLATAAVLGVDACPMEGFVADKYDELLKLPEQGYHAVVLATAGYRAADDKNAGMAKVRYEPAEVVGHI
jgi:nitroreductase